MATIRIIQACNAHYTIEAKSEVPNIPDFTQIDRTVLEVPEALQAALDHLIVSGIHRKDIQIAADQEATEWTLEALDEDRNARDTISIPPEWNIEHIEKFDEKVIVMAVAKGSSISLRTLASLDTVTNYLKATGRELICVTSDIQFLRAVPKK